MIRDETILLTGGAGFIGAALARRLAPHNQVRVFDTFSRSAPEETPVAAIDGVSVMVGDVRDADAVAEAVSGADRVVHLASIAGVGTVLSNPARTLDVALTGTRNVLEAARRCDTPPRVVVFSTSEVYGRMAWDAREEEPTPIGPVGQPRWSYACAKIATEHLAEAYMREFGIPTVSVRPFNVYGPGQLGEGAIHNFVRRAITGEPITVYNDGRQLRSWCYVDDMVDGTARALEAPSAPGHAFNIGNPQATITVLRLAELVAREAGGTANIQFETRDYPDVEVRVPNIDRARRLLGFEPTVGLDEGIRRTVAWYKESAR
jgi:nucleoside-diphosphate-sugar epimerase